MKKLLLIFLSIFSLTVFAQDKKTVAVSEDVSMSSGSCSYGRSVRLVK